MALTFDPIPHIYRYDGRIVPSVTQILEGTGVIDYSHIPPSTRNMALERGSAVHRAIHFDCEGDLDESTVGDLMGYVDAARRARLDLGITGTLDEVERREYHAVYGYAGTKDLQHGDLLIDWKTNEAQGWVKWQLAAYAGFDSTPGRLCRMCIELHGDGTYRPITFPAKEWRQDFGEFLAFLTTYRAQELFGCRSRRKERAA